MKMSRSQFKTLMKECLSELINEGAFDKKLEKIAESKFSKPAQIVEAKSPSLLYGYGQQNSTPSENMPNVNPKLLEAVKNVTSAQPKERKGLFEEIMLDTAMTTLQRQLSNGDAFGNAGALYNEAPVSGEIAALDEAQLKAMSGGNVSRWALAAFGGNKRKR